MGLQLYPTPGSRKNLNRRSRLSTAQAIPNVTWTAMIFDINGGPGGVDPFISMSGSRWTIGPGGAGHYMVHASIPWAAGTGSRLVYVWRNGLDYDQSTYRYGRVAGPADSVQGPIQNIFETMELAVNDYVEIAVYQNSGGALNVSTYQSGLVAGLVRLEDS